METVEKQRLKSSIPFSKVSATVGDSNVREEGEGEEGGEEENEENTFEFQTHKVLGFAGSEVKSAIKRTKNINNQFDKMQNFIENVGRKLTSFKGDSEEEAEEVPNVHHQEENLVVPVYSSSNPAKKFGWMVPQDGLELSEDEVVFGQDWSRPQDKQQQQQQLHSTNSFERIESKEFIYTHRRRDRSSEDSDSYGSEKRDHSESRDKDDKENLTPRFGSIKKVRSAVNRKQPSGFLVPDINSPFHSAETAQLTPFMKKMPFDQRFFEELPKSSLFANQTFVPKIANENDVPQSKADSEAEVDEEDKYSDRWGDFLQRSKEISVPIQEKGKGKIKSKDILESPDERGYYADDSLEDFEPKSFRRSNMFLLKKVTPESNPNPLTSHVSKQLFKKENPSQQQRVPESDSQSSYGDW